MSKLLRALFITSVATGAAAVVLHLLRPNPSSKETSASPDVEDMSPEEQKALLEELAAQL